MTAKRVIYEGRVQGVGFRYQVKQMAMGYDLRGWVRNLQDGRVELVVLGDPAEMAAFLQEIDDSDLAGFIRGKEETLLAEPPVCSGFAIRR